MGNMSQILVFLILLESFGMVQNARIIMTSPQIRSHILEQVALGEALALRGHDVYVAIGSRYPDMKSIERRGVKTLKYRIPDDVMYGVSEDFERTSVGVVFDPKEDVYRTVLQLVSRLGYSECSYMMDDDVFLDTARKLSFDLAIVEPFVATSCTLILPKYLAIPYVSLTPLYSPWRIRIPALPSFYPLTTVWTDSSEITLLSRLRNVVAYPTTMYHFQTIFPENRTLLDRFAPGVQSWDDLVRNSELFLAEIDHHLGNPVPEMPNYVSVAGLTTSRAKKLPQNIESIIENSPEGGVILLSFGSIAYYFPTEVITRFLEAFSKLNRTVLLKLFIPDGVKVPENVKVLSWLPQNDILGHPQTKLFITHCGNNGQHEALYHGVPMIGFPLFTDQHVNCNRAYKKGFGLVMDIIRFTPDELLANIQEVLNNPKYRSTIVKASEVFRDQPMHPRERGAFWVEHVIKHGGKHLRMLSMDLPLYQFLMLDVFFVIGIGVISF